LSLIKVQDLKFKYPGTSDPVLDLSGFSIEKGEKIFIFGPSGSGKSTLLEILAGVLPADRGSVEILGKDLVKMTAAERDEFRASHLGYVFQSFNLIPYLSVEENIELPLFLSPARSSKVKDPKKDIQFLAERLGLTSFLQRKVTDLSVGQQQRVAVARALLGKPEVILADEPTSALDYDHREKFVSLLFELAAQQGTTVIFVSHDRGLEKLFSRSLSFQELNRRGESV
jgi:putative ABC transport system ATP-binding protein